MGYQVYEDRAARDLGVARWAGYGVPGVCDRPDCTAELYRGLDSRCGEDVDTHGCGLSFCGEHMVAGWDAPQMCTRCVEDEPPFTPKPDTAEWENHMLSDDSWGRWRAENPERVAEMRARAEGVTP